MTNCGDSGHSWVSLLRMPKLDKRRLRPCNLEPVEKEVEKPLPGVPLHFNYGIFFDDNYDYMQHLKSISEFQDQTTFRIAGIPEDSVSDVPDLAPVVELPPRQPELDADDHIVADGLNLDSDVDSETTSMCEPLEENFIELAGGNSVRQFTDEDCGDEMSDTSPLKLSHNGQNSKASGLSSLRQEKVMMMERFLYGDNERAQTGGQSSDEEIAVPDEVTLENQSFEKLIRKCKEQRSGTSANQSWITGTSMMSEGLQFALSRDSCIVHRREPKTDHLEELNSELKLKTIVREEQIDAASCTSDDGSGTSVAERLDALSLHSEVPHVKVNQRCLLVVPTNPKPSVLKKLQLRKQQSTPLSSDDNQPDATLSPKTSEVNRRRRDESKEEKKHRKSAIKQARQERRQIRKANQLAFRQERKLQLQTIIPSALGVR